ncbi:unnamed protein product [Auanema sp. JU1783]|nr:unnamed protein product [Auanema sp. JU1783]
MKLYIILFYFLQILLLVYFFDWRIPIRLRNVLFRVVGGFPNFVHAQFYDLTNATHPVLERETDFGSSEIFSQNRFSKFTLHCHSLLGDGNTCFSEVSKHHCRLDGQYSYGYWKGSNNLTRCVKANQEVLCANATIRDDRCLNIVGNVYFRKTSTLIELVDEDLGEIVEQKLHAVEPDADVEHPCYESHDFVSMSNTINTIVEDDNGSCIKGTLRARFGMNSSNTCLYATEQKNCSSIQYQLLEWWRNLQPSVICNCGSCKVPYLEHSTSSPSLSSEDCLLPLESHYLFTFHQGSIKGVLNKLIWSAVRPSNRVAVKKKIAFIPLKTSSPLSRFQAKRGRFYCPADSGCWKSFFYIFGRFEDITWSHQIALIVTAMLFTLVLIRQKPVDEGCCRKFPFAYFPGSELRET